MLASPCVNLCRMDTRSGLCQGCLRTIDEITDWAHADDAHRTVILAAVAARRAVLGAECPPPSEPKHG